MRAGCKGAPISVEGTNSLWFLSRRCLYHCRQRTATTSFSKLCLGTWLLDVWTPTEESCLSATLDLLHVCLVLWSSRCKPSYLMPRLTCSAKLPFFDHTRSLPHHIRRSDVEIEPVMEDVEVSKAVGRSLLKVSVKTVSDFTGIFLSPSVCDGGVFVSPSVVDAERSFSKASSNEAGASFLRASCDGGASVNEKIHIMVCPLREKEAGRHGGRREGRGWSRGMSKGKGSGRGRGRDRGMTKELSLEEQGPWQRHGVGQEHGLGQRYETPQFHGTLVMCCAGRCGAPICDRSLRQFGAYIIRSCGGY